VSRFVTLLGTGLLIGAAALHSGCGSNSTSILGASSTSSAPVTSTFVPDVTGRPEQVAFISACGQAYGFAHDSGKLRTAYLAYEAKRGAGPAQLGDIQKAYDTTYQAIGALGHRQASFCSTKDGETVKSELRRYTSGFFEPRSPVPAAASEDWKKTRVDADCGARC